MAKYLLNQTDVYAVDTIDEVDEMKKEFINDDDFELSSFGYKVKPIKDGKEVVGEYYLITAKKVYLTEKELY